jgi:hypothetical protein
MDIAIQKGKSMQEHEQIPPPNQFDKADGVPPPDKSRGLPAIAFCEQFSETDKQTPRTRVSAAADYSAHMLEAMRHNRLRSSDYPLVMSIMRAITQGHTEEQWKAENQRSLKVLIDQPTDKADPHADATDRYEQTAMILKDINLWPW